MSPSSVWHTGREFGKEGERERKHGLKAKSSQTVISRGSVYSLLVGPVVHAL